MLVVERLHYIVPAVGRNQDRTGDPVRLDVIIL